jgi:SpoVK/Ycf46/Vps4 family AAA+-type ATPase
MNEYLHRNSTRVKIDELTKRARSIQYDLTQPSTTNESQPTKPSTNQSNPSSNQPKPSNHPQKPSNSTQKDTDDTELEKKLSSAIIKQKPTITWDDVAGLKEALNNAVITPLVFLSDLKHLGVNLLQAFYFMNLLEQENHI